MSSRRHKPQGSCRRPFPPPATAPPLHGGGAYASRSAVPCHLHDLYSPLRAHKLLSEVNFGGSARPVPAAPQESHPCRQRSPKRYVSEFGTLFLDLAAAV